MVVHYRPRREKESDRQKAALLNGKFSRAALIVYGIFGLFPFAELNPFLNFFV